MAKSVKKQEEEQKAGGFQKFLYFFVIPVLFTGLVFLILLSVLGVNVFEKAKEWGSDIPVISSIIGKESKAGIAKYEDKIISLQAEMKDNNARMSQLESELESKERERERLALEKQTLESEIEELRKIQEDNKRAFKEIVSTYESMSAKSAAPILAKMKDEDAVQILSKINTESLAKIMEKMPPEKAAKYTEMISTAN